MNKLWTCVREEQQQEAFGAAFRSIWTSDGNTQTLIPIRELAHAVNHTEPGIALEWVVS